MKDISKLFDNKTFIVQEPENGQNLTPCMDVYKYKIQSDGSLDKIRLRIAVRGDIQNKHLVGDNLSSTD